MAKYNDFDEPEGDGVFDQILTIVGKRKREFAIASVSAAVILLGLIVWGSYPDDNNAGQASVPIVRADAGDYKTTPDNPGGMEIPYRDSTVFSSGEQSDGPTENILAEDTSEQPVPRSQLFAGLNTEGSPVLTEDPADLAASAPSQGELEDTQAQLAKAEPVGASPNDDLIKEAIGTTDSATTTAKAEPVAPPAEQTLASAATTATEPVKAPLKASIDKAAEKIAKTEPAAGAASAAAKAITPGGYYIQVGSVRSESGAAGEWKKIQAKYNGLGGLQYRTQEANLGAKGIFYRIQAGPMSKESADNICGSMKAKAPGSCLVTK